MTKIDEKQAKLELEGQVLGNPLGPERDAGFGGSVREYENGHIYWHEVMDEEARLVRGGILARYLAVGGPGPDPNTGERKLGFPLTDEVVTPDGEYVASYFESGVIHWREGAGTVFGVFYDEWRASGAELGTLGYPVSEVLASGGGAAIFFERGCVWHAGGAGAVPLRLTLTPPQLGQPALVAPGADRFVLRLFTPDDVPPSLGAERRDLLRELYGNRLFLRSVTRPGEASHEMALQIGPLPAAETRIAPSSTLRERTLYDLCFRGPDGLVVPLAPHAIYAKAGWEAFGFVHVTDTHVSRRLDGFGRRLLELGYPEGAARFNNYNDAFRDFVKYANQLHLEGKLDFILATGDIVDYVFEDGDHPKGRGNFGLLEDLILGRVPYPTGGPAEELRVPCFICLGNHDYRANPYPLMFMLDIGVGDLAGEVPVLGDLLDSVGSIASRIPLLGDLFRSTTSIPAPPILNFSPLNLTRQEAHALMGGRVENGMPLLPAFGMKTAARFVEVDPDMRSHSSYYFRRLNRDSNYIVRAGIHRFVMLDSRWDAGVVNSAHELVWAALGNGHEDRIRFVGGGPNSVGPQPTDVQLVRTAISEATTFSAVVIGIHAPLFNIQGTEYAHYLRETEHPTADLTELRGFIVRQGLGGTQTEANRGRRHELEKTWLLRGTAHFKEGGTDDLLDDGVCKEADGVLEACIGRGVERQVDLVLFGHVHHNVEFGMGYDPDRNRRLYFHDYFTENPATYYPSIQVEHGDPNQRRTVHVRIDPQAPLGAQPEPLAAPPDDPVAFKPCLQVSVPPYAEPLDAASDPLDWWHDHQPLFIQTAALGPLENTQRFDPANPTRPAPTFQGFRAIQVENNLMRKIRYVTLRSLREGT